MSGNMDSADEIRQQEEQIQNETPSLVTDDETDDSGRSLPMPSLSRRQAMLLGLVAVIVVAVVIYRRRQQRDTDDESTAGMATESGDEPAKQSADESTSGEGIDVPQSNADPLAADEAITQEFRDRGKISDSPEA